MPPRPTANPIRTSGRAAQSGAVDDGEDRDGQQPRRRPCAIDSSWLAVAGDAARRGVGPSHRGSATAGQPSTGRAGPGKPPAGPQPARRWPRRWSRERARPAAIAAVRRRPRARAARAASRVARTVATGSRVDRDELVDGRPARRRAARARSGPAASPSSTQRGAGERPSAPAVEVASARPEVVDQLRDAGDDPGLVRELAQERQAAGRARLVDRPGHEEAVAALLERPRRGDQRAAPGRRLDDDRGVGEAADDPVAPRERALASARCRARAPTRPLRRPRRSPSARRRGPAG